MDSKVEAKFFKTYKFLNKKDMKKFECGDGWQSIFENLFKSLQSLPPPTEFKITKIFAKCNNLNIYTKKGNNSTRFAIEEAAQQAEDICNACGFNKDLESCGVCKQPVYVPPPKKECECEKDCKGGCDDCDFDNEDDED